MCSRRGLTILESVMLVFSILATATLALLLLNSHYPDGPMKRTPCAANLKLQGLAISIYQATYNSWPVSSGAVHNLCEQTVDVRDALINFCSNNQSEPKAASLQKALYCPSNHYQDPAKLWTQGTVSTWGYVWLNDRGPANEGLVAAFPPRTPPLTYRTSLNAPNTAQQEIALDVIESDKPTAPMNFTGKGTPLPFGTNHFNNAQPAGANVLHLDNHVAWRTFDTATARPISQSPAGFLWVPDPQ